MAKRKGKTKYQALVSSKHNFCKGKTTKAAVRKHASAYVKHSVTKLGRTATGAEKKKAKAEAKRVASRILKAGCKMTPVIAKKKRSRKRK